MSDQDKAKLFAFGFVTMFCGCVLAPLPDFATGVYVALFGLAILLYSLR